MPGYSTHVGLKDIVLVYLKNILNAIIRPLWVNPTTGSIRLIDTVTTCSTLTTVTNTVGICPSTAAPGAAAGGLAVWDAMTTIPMKNEWSNTVRRQIT